MEKALEFFHFDFEFSDEPSDTSLKQNYDVRIGIQLHLLQVSLGFQVFQVDKQYPDMSKELQNVADMANNICVMFSTWDIFLDNKTSDIFVKFLLKIFFSRKTNINLQKSNNFRGTLMTWQTGPITSICLNFHRLKIRKNALIHEKDVTFCNTACSSQIPVAIQRLLQSWYFWHYISR